MATLLAVSAHQCACRAPNQKRFGKAGKISVIIPIWRDGDGLIPLVQRLISFPEIREVIISAAEPSVNLRKRIEMLGAIFVQNAKPNRGSN
jgi:hypothetical protein